MDGLVRLFMMMTFLAPHSTTDGEAVTGGHPGPSMTFLQSGKKPNLLVEWESDTQARFGKPL